MKTMLIDHQCCRCGTIRPMKELVLVPGAGWACSDAQSGVTCAMQLEYRGYGRQALENA